MTIKQPIGIGKMDVTFRVHDGTTYLGDVTISQGGIDWRKSHARSSVKKGWLDFDKLMQGDA